MDEQKIYKLALSLIPKVGPLLARRLVSYTGGVEAVFKEKKSLLARVPGIGKELSGAVQQAELLRQAEQELKYITKNKIQSSFYLDDDYPWRLKECEDAPVNIFWKGEVNFNIEKVISIVGTRNATEYGRLYTHELVEVLSQQFRECLIVSGLAFGIDVAAHKAALEFSLPTVAVLGHGLDHIYPSQHAKYASDIASGGALISEFISSKKPDPGNFVSRNRIIAGLADVTIVVESGARGGALITADMANGYNREVFAFPGRASDKYSRGCNMLIKSNKAGLIESGQDLIQAMSWEPQKQKPVRQAVLFEDINPEESQILELLKKNENLAIDDICHQLELSLSFVSSTLLGMEFKGMIATLPGKVYKSLV